jgi:lysozyme
MTMPNLEQISERAKGTAVTTAGMRWPLVGRDVIVRVRDPDTIAGMARAAGLSEGVPGFTTFDPDDPTRTPIVYVSELNAASVETWRHELWHAFEGDFHSLEKMRAAGWIGRLREFTQRHEGLRLLPYRDSVGVLTIGYGWNLDQNGLPPDVCDLLYFRAEAAAIKEAEALPYWSALPEVWRFVVAAMLYQLGRSRFGRFVKMNAALAGGDWRRARTEMLDSKWARSDSPGRAQELELAAERDGGSADVQA